MSTRFPLASRQLLSFIGQLTGAKLEPSDDGRKALDGFRAEIKKQKNCTTWKDSGELVLAVIQRIQNLKKSHPGVGWIKGSEASDASLKETLELRRQVESLNAELDETKRRLVPAETDDLQQGSDGVNISVSIHGPEQSTQQHTAFLSWQEVFRVILPNTFGGGAERFENCWRSLRSCP
jgi:hypothetical protein